MNNFSTQEWKWIRIGVIIFVFLASLFLLVKTVSALKGIPYVGAADKTVNTISFSGVGEVKAIPDTAVITATLSHTGADANSAQILITKDEKAVLKFLKDSGIADKDIKAEGISSYPEYAPQPAIYCISVNCPRPQINKISGYSVNETITIKVRKADDAGEIVAGVTALGVNQVSGPNYQIDDQDALNREARQKAITDAKTKAEALASDLGIHLVKIISFSENGNYPMPMYATKATAMDSMAGSAPELPKGENTITSNVTITYEIR